MSKLVLALLLAFYCAWAGGLSAGGAEIRRMHGKNQTKAQGRIAHKANQLRTEIRRARAARRAHEHGGTPPPGNSTPGRPGTPKRGGTGSRELARLGSKPSEGNRPHGSGIGPLTVGTPLTGRSRGGVHSSLLFREGDKSLGRRPTIKVLRHTKASSFRKAAAGLFRPRDEIQTSHEGIATSNIVGSAIHEYESIEDGTRHLTIAGREWLGPVGLDFASASTVALQEGDRVPGGIVPISPAFLGGRLQLSQAQFEQHKAKRFRVRYEPVVPATTDGAIAIYFRNDVGNPTVAVGANELGHAATHEAFIQTTVWNSVEVSIDPSAAINQYFDYDSGEARFEVQGIIEVLAASGLTFDPSGAAAPSTYGHLYLDYEVEFMTPSLEDSVPLRQRAMITLTADVTATGGISDGYPLRSRDTVSSAGTYLHSVEGLPTGVSSAADLDGYMFYGTLVSDWQVSVGVNAAFTLADDPTGREFTGGVGLWADFSRVAGGGGYTMATWYGDLASLTELEGADQPDGAVEWTSGLYPANGNVMRIVGYFVKKTSRNG